MEHTTYKAQTTLTLFLSSLIVTVSVISEATPINDSSTLKSDYEVGSTSRQSQCRGEVRSHKPLNSLDRERVITIHGLNNNRDAMFDIGSEISSMFHVEHLQLPGHVESLCLNVDMAEVWMSSYSDAISEGKSNVLSSIGYSLGGLVAAAHAAGDELSIPRKLILIAPAIRLNSLRLPLHLGVWLLPDSLLLPSRTQEHVRAFPEIPVSYYTGLRNLQNSLNSSIEMLASKKIPTLVVLNRSDRLISKQRTESFIRDNSLSTWRTLEVSPLKNGTIEDSHLIITKDALGESEWNRLIQAVIEFLKE